MPLSDARAKFWIADKVLSTTRIWNIILPACATEKRAVLDRLTGCFVVPENKKLHRIRILFLGDFWVMLPGVGHEEADFLQ